MIPELSKPAWAQQEKGMTSEAKVKTAINQLLSQSGWHVCDLADANIHASRVVAIREFPLNTGFGFTDYLPYIDSKAAGVIEARKEGTARLGVQVQSVLSESFGDG
jgi:type I restriction enzyme, R subunit